MRVSCSEIGDGPGTGGRGEDGGSEGGGFTKEDEESGLGTAKGEPWRGLAGMCVGGAGKEDKRRGTALRLSARRDSVKVEDMVCVRVWWKRFMVSVKRKKRRERERKLTRRRACVER